MKLYLTKSYVVTEAETEGAYHTDHFKELTSSSDAASKTRTRLKKLKHEGIETEEVEIEMTRAGLIKFLNERWAHESWIVEPTAAALRG